MTAVSIRRFESSDADACVKILDRAWHVGHPYAPRVIEAVTFAEETAEETILVAESAGRTVGFASVYLPESFLHHLYVDPDFAGRGIGTALLRRAVILAGGRASLKCQTRNHQALAFYRRHGWMEVAAGTSEYGAWVAMRSP